MWGRLRVLVGVVAASAVATLAWAEGRPPARTASRAAPAKPSRTARYAEYVRAWHAASPTARAPRDARGRPMLVLAAINNAERATLAASGEGGGFAASELDRAARLLREPGTGNMHPIEPRLLDLAYRLQTHFDAPEVRFVSAYRTPRGRGSNHGRGRALDMVVPGTSDEDVATYARELGFVGVGVYPSSGFVHVDVRARSYFWVDASGPGRRTRERGVLPELAKTSDTQAAARGEQPIAPFSIAGDVDVALRARGIVVEGATADEDCEDMDADPPAGTDAPSSE